MTDDETNALIAAAYEAAAQRVDQRKDDYVNNHGIYDTSTGVTEFPGDGAEWVGEWEEIAADIRAMIPDDARAALERAKAVKVKPLVWVEMPHQGNSGRTRTAETGFGRYEVSTGWENGKAAAFRYKRETRWFRTEDEAMVVLDADYEARVRAMNDNVVDRQEGEEG